MNGYHVSLYEFEFLHVPERDAAREFDEMTWQFIPRECSL